MSDRDDCEFCLGYKGGVKGNENVVAGVVMCDYCHALFHSAHQRYNREKLARKAARDRELEELLIRQQLLIHQPPPVILPATSEDLPETEASHEAR